MAIKRSRREIDTEADSAVPTGPTQAPPELGVPDDPAQKAGELTGLHDDDERTPSRGAAGKAPGRSWPDLIQEIKHEPEYTSIALILLSVTVLLAKMDLSQPNPLLQPLLLAAVLHAVFFGIRGLRAGWRYWKRRQRKPG